MPYSAPALGVGLRLRSRRVRSDRSQQSTSKLALIAAVLAALAGFLGSTVREESLPWFGRGPVTSSTDKPAAAGGDPVTESIHDRASGRGVEVDRAWLPAAENGGMLVADVARGAAIGLPLAVVLAPRPLALDEQRYADSLWSIHTRIEQTIARVGLGAAFYRSQEIDRGELRTRLSQGLNRYRIAETQIEALDPPPSLRTTHEGYLAAVRLFQLSALEMLRMYEDGDDEHLSTALPFILDGTNKLREIGVQFWPESYLAS